MTVYLPTTEATSLLLNILIVCVLQLLLGSLTESGDDGGARGAAVQILQLRPKFVQIYFASVCNLARKSGLANFSWSSNTCSYLPFIGHLLQFPVQTHPDL